MRWLAAVATILTLHRAGWTIDAPPGAPVTARREGTEIAPFEVVAKLADGTLTSETWRSEAERLGVGALRLAA